MTSASGAPEAYTNPLMALPKGLINPRYLPLSAEKGKRLAQTPPRHGVMTELPGFLTDEGVAQFRREARELLEHGTRRDLYLHGTPRKLRTVNQATLARLGKLIPGLLEAPELLQFLGGIAGEDIVPYGDYNEAAVLLHLEQVGDTHGGHNDQFLYTFGVALEIPGKYEKGGHLEYVPNADDPKLLLGKGRHEHHMQPGDAYLMHRPDLHIHRVSPLQLAQSRRTMLSLALSTPEEADRPSESSDAMFGDDRM